jgi:signal transduction histidine kinase
MRRGGMRKGFAWSQGLCRSLVVQADRRALRTILDNLLANALRYTPEAAKYLLEAEERKDFIQFTVRDTGRGIERSG